MRARTLIGVAVMVSMAGACSRQAATSSPPAESAPPQPDRVTVPDDWGPTRDEAIRLFQQDKRDESTALLTKFVDAHPDFAPGHYELAQNHELTPGIGRMTDAERIAHLNAAVLHYTRARELAVDPLDRSQATMGLALTFGPDRLNQLDEAVRVGREYISEQPAEVWGYDTVARFLRLQGKAEQGVEVLSSARDRITMFDRDNALAGVLVDHVKESPGLSAANANALLHEAEASADRLLKGDPAMYPDGILNPAELRASGLLLKSHLLAARAGRSADAGEKKRLLAEAADLERQGKALLQ